MNDPAEKRFKTEIDEIFQRINMIMKKVRNACPQDETSPDHNNDDSKDKSRNQATPESQTN